MIRRLTLMLCVMAVVSALPSAALAQKSVADVLGRTATPEGQPKSYLEEIMLFSYVENSYVANLGRTGRGNVNELRLFPHRAARDVSGHKMVQRDRRVHQWLGQRR